MHGYPSSLEGTRGISGTKALAPTLLIAREVQTLPLPAAPFVGWFGGFSTLVALSGVLGELEPPPDKAGGPGRLLGCGPFAGSSPHLNAQFTSAPPKTREEPFLPLSEN
jgi:hypothetical protein